jgi:hypothetical protein
MDTKSKTHEANPQKGFVVQINASENFGLTSERKGTPCPTVTAQKRTIEKFAQR